jgi:hypothetical protein
MTATGTRRPTSGDHRHRPVGDVAGSAPRLARLYLQSRRAPAAVGLLAALGALLWVALYWRWNIAGGPAAQQFIPVTIESAAAGIIAVTSYGPFGESERAAGRWLPLLRLASTALLTAIAIGVLAAGASGGHLPGGSVALLRNVAGITGTGLIAATALGGPFGWTGPMTYLLITESALSARWTTPVIWAGRPPHDIGAALCAALTFAVATALITVRGDRA